ncbi:hypothetical protein GGP41_010197 [Bipolaris sorokiniana]|uniref:Uncharacterized protein n=2 Tax=Cochliobolus sativus TaxID=45130 RepID=A0A8H6DW08_COCSA|nr:uncharacterized protein COCSADRAFT_35352 [Bipolaris sorokiniana ND90Pr]EMD65280.1 hypothetical protein COCSADRAFT_35352 [Bipolaris sorokiniana ND90Pr]KAF5850531.1 hypothetical protein GGP41_010197 [Bipolaris sorokiniana]
MKFSITLPVIAAILNVASADLHYGGICADWPNGAATYNQGATQKACDSYFRRNTGNEKWDKCPDCKMADKGGISICTSYDWHMGGDEWEYYCKMHGAGGAIAS